MKRQTRFRDLEPMPQDCEHSEYSDQALHVGHLFELQFSTDFVDPEYFVL